MSLNIPMQVKPKVVKYSKQLLKRKWDLIKHFHRVRVKGNAVKYFEILYVSSLAYTHSFFPIKKT